MSYKKPKKEDFRNFIKNVLFNPISLSSNETTDGQKGLVGLELEIFSLRRDGDSLSPAQLYGGEDPLIDRLLSVSKTYGGEAIYTTCDQGLKVIDKIKFQNGNYFHFEPGGQIEIRTHPFGKTIELDKQIQLCKKILDEIAETSCYRFLQTGTNSFFEGSVLKNQIQKPRYIRLEQYLNAISPFGRQMMFQTCSLHINLDLGMDEMIRFKRIAVANLLVPFATALFANSPMIDGKSTGMKSYRSRIWQQLDPLRTGILPLDKALHNMDLDYIVEAYTEFALKAPLVYIPEIDYMTLPPSFTMNYWLANSIEGIYPDRSHFENHVSLLFPEVRIKGYLEIRSVDATPAEWEMIPVLFYMGLLYSSPQLNKALDRLTPYVGKIQILQQKSVYGLEDYELFIISKDLMELSIEGLLNMMEEFADKTHFQKYLTFYERMTLQRKSFADFSVKAL
jgi:glutamate--cysteine ligase